MRNELTQQSTTHSRQTPLLSSSHWEFYPSIFFGQDAGPRDFARVVNDIFLSVNLIGRVKKKRNDVTEIVSELEIADVIFRRYDRKYVCCSQATLMAFMSGV